MERGAAPEATPRIDEHFEHIRANLIRCEECSENFFFDFLRHPRYFVTHFKTCHLKNVLYRFNGSSEEENQRVRFGPRRKKDATAWFGQLKSTEKRMISMQDNKWGEIAERECWSCQLCKNTRKTGEVPHAFEPNEMGRRQALLHLRQFHEAAYNGFLCSFSAVNTSSGPNSVQSQEQAQRIESEANIGVSTGISGFPPGNMTIADQRGQNLSKTQSQEAERSRLRRMKATPEAKKAEAERSRRRRAQMTPAQRQADVERRSRKRQREEERARSRLRRADASPEAKEREMKRSRERRQNATDQQRGREAQRSRKRRQNATEEQRLRERERCRRRYETRKKQKLVDQQSGAGSGVLNLDTPATRVSEALTPLPSEQTTPSLRNRVLPADLALRSRQLQQQQDGLGLEIQSLYESLTNPSQHHDTLP